VVFEIVASSWKQTKQVPKVPVATISHLSMNAYAVPWLHLNIIGCVMKFFGPSLHSYLCDFLLLATIFEQVQQSFCSSFSHFFCHMPHGFEV
jgi:hypothetical protein